VYHVFGAEYLLDAILRTRPGRIVLSLLTCVGTTLLVVLLVPMQLDAVVLAGRHVAAVGAVYDGRQSTSTELFSSKRSMIQYVFRVDGVEYYKRARYGRVWTKVPEQDYDRMSSTNAVPVIYDPQNPWNNDWAGNAAGLRWWAFVCCAGVVSGAAAAWFWVARVAADEVRRLLVPSRQPAA
jgi:hypothetical protein